LNLEINFRPLSYDAGHRNLEASDHDIKTDPRLERILLMEDRYDKVSRVLTVLEEAVSEYEKCRDELDILDGYMSSGQWKEDFEADEAGLIPCRSHF